MNKYHRLLETLVPLIIDPLEFDKHYSVTLKVATHYGLTNAQLLIILNEIILPQTKSKFKQSQQIKAINLLIARDILSWDLFISILGGLAVVSSTTIKTTLLSQDDSSQISREKTNVPSKSIKIKLANWLLNNIFMFDYEKEKEKAIGILPWMWNLLKFGHTRKEIVLIISYWLLVLNTTCINFLSIDRVQLLIKLAETDSCMIGLLQWVIAKLDKEVLSIIYTRGKTQLSGVGGSYVDLVRLGKNKLSQLGNAVNKKLNYSEMHFHLTLLKGKDKKLYVKNMNIWKNSWLEKYSKCGDLGSWVDRMYANGQISIIPHLLTLKSISEFENGQWDQNLLEYLDIWLRCDQEMFENILNVAFKYDNSSVTLTPSTKSILSSISIFCQLGFDLPLLLLEIVEGKILVFDADCNPIELSLKWLKQLSIEFWIEHLPPLSSKSSGMKKLESILHLANLVEDKGLICAFTQLAIRWNQKSPKAARKLIELINNKHCFIKNYAKCMMDIPIDCNIKGCICNELV